jgi:hypothetical protein
MSSSSNTKCPVCNRSFGTMLWKHTCDVCHRTVCDDCAPRKTEGVDANGEATKLRVCKLCGSSGRRLGDATIAGKSASASPTGAEAAPRPDPNSEAERERRAAIIEARNKSQQSRGRPQGWQAATGTRATPVPPVSSSSSNSALPVQTSNVTTVTAAASSSTPPNTTAASLPSSTAANSASRPSNPALEAALRRQERQQRARGGAAAAAQTASMSPEKTRLLREIEGLMAKHSEEPPFGLRASNETKLKSYLQYLKTKYHISE